MLEKSKYHFSHSFFLFYRHSLWLLPIQDGNCMVSLMVENEVGNSNYKLDRWFTQNSTSLTAFLYFTGSYLGCFSSMAGNLVFSVVARFFYFILLYIFEVDRRQKYNVFGINNASFVDLIFLVDLVLGNIYTRLVFRHVFRPIDWRHLFKTHF
ncbi:unnamed protein product [Mucor hiemalis]